ncbi:MAG: formylmethanofuran dehydrogenase subunit E family protein [Desulfosudis oleivorans]|nr:formylmethanofuran dehydrogenase subunit E family protein [Desulfosudis oleivorans]
MCFGDGVQYATGCTLGKGNMDKTPCGKLAVTVIERATNRAIAGELQADAAKAHRRVGLHGQARPGHRAGRHSRGRADGTGGPGLERARSRCAEPGRGLPVRARLAARDHGLRALRRLPRTHRACLPARGGRQACVHSVLGLRTLRRAGEASRWPGGKPAGHRPTQRVQSGETSLDGRHRATRSRTS